MRQRLRGAFGGRARGDGAEPARPVRAGVPAAAGVWSAAASIVGFSLAVAIVGVPFGAAVRLPRAATSAAAPTATGLLGLGTAAGVHRAAASQPVVQRQFDEQLDEQLAEQQRQ